MQTLKIEVDIEDITPIADITPKDASKLCEYIYDYLIKHYIVVNVSYSVNGGE